MKIKYYTGKKASEQEVETNSILNAIELFRVLKIKKLKNGNTKLTERCDDYFSVELDKQQVKQFILELENLIT